MRLALLANDASGSGTGAEAIAAALAGHGADVTVHDVRALAERAGIVSGPADVASPGATGGLVAALATLGMGDDAPQRLVVAGGDGSIAPAATLAAAAGLPLAVVPTGTANDLARALDLPLALEAAVALAAQPTVRTRTIDLAQAGRRPFVNAASAGLSVHAARRARPLKRLLGPVAYAVGALRAGLTARPIAATVTVDGRLLHDGPAWQVVVANTGAFGGGSELDVADPTDGLIDVAVVEAGPRWALVRRAYGMRAGGLADQAGVRHGRGLLVEAIVDDARFNVDGELCRVTPPTFALDGRCEMVVG